MATPSQNLKQRGGLFASFSSPQTYNMPLFIAHIAYLKKFWDEQKFSTDLIDQAIFGTLLPDIRYPSTAQRKQTHLAEFLDGLNFTNATNKIFNNKNILKFDTKNLWWLFCHMIR